MAPILLFMRQEEKKMNLRFIKAAAIFYLFFMTKFLSAGKLDNKESRQMVIVHRCEIDNKISGKIKVTLCSQKICNDKYETSKFHCFGSGVCNHQNSNLNTFFNAVVNNEDNISAHKLPNDGLFLIETEQKKYIIGHDADVGSISDTEKLIKSVEDPRKSARIKTFESFFNTVDKQYDFTNNLKAQIKSASNKDVCPF